MSSSERFKNPHTAAGLPQLSFSGQCSYYYMAGDFDSLERLLKLAVAGGTDLEVSYWRAMILIQREEFRRAFQVLDSILSIQHQDGRLYALAASVLVRLGELKQACEVYAKAIEKEPLEESYRKALALLYYKNGQFDDVDEVLGPLFFNCKGLPDRALRKLYSFCNEKLLSRVSYKDGELTGWVMVAPETIQTTFDIYIKIDSRASKISVPLKSDPIGSYASWKLVISDKPVCIEVLDDNRNHIEGAPIYLSAPEPVLKLPIRQRVAVVVPVYGDLELTRLCLKRLLASQHKNSEPFDIVVVNDCSPVPEIKYFLRELAKNKKIDLLESSRNQGFILTVNEALKHCADQDVVLLNADALVSGNWFDRMKTAAYSQDNIATVTPYSNFAELVSFPVSMENNPFLGIGHAEAIDQAASVKNSGRVSNIPVGVGFCMYIRRAALNQVGYLDQVDLQRGYGEEVDLCLRFRKCGWVNVCAEDVFVAHIGSRSFKGEKGIRVAQNNRVLEQRYSNYRKEYFDFVRGDCLREGRSRIEFELINQLVCKERVQAVWYPLELPSFKAVLERQGFSDSEHGPVLVFAYQPEINSVSVTLEHKEGLLLSNLQYDLTEDLEQLKVLLSCIEPERLSITLSKKGPDKPLLNLCSNMSCSYQVIVAESGHEDFSETDNPAHWEQIVRFYQTARYVVFGSQAARVKFIDNLGVGLPQSRVLSTSLSIANQNRSAVKAVESELHIAVLDGHCVDTGYRTLLALAQCIARDQMPVRLWVLGDTINNLALLNTGVVEVSPSESKLFSVGQRLDAAGIDRLLMVSATAPDWLDEYHPCFETGIPLLVNKSIALDEWPALPALRSVPLEPAQAFLDMIRSDFQGDGAWKVV